MLVLVERLSRNWGWVALRGIVAMGVGLMALQLHASTFHALVALFGVYLIVDGLGMTVSALSLLKGTPVATLFLVEGPLSILAGLLSPFLPAVTAVMMVYLWAFWALCSGILVLVSSQHLRSLFPDEVFVVSTGAVMVLVGVTLFFLPTAGLATWTWLIGVYAMVYGLSHIGLATRLRLVTSTLDAQRSRTDVQPRVEDLTAVPR